MACIKDPSQGRRMGPTYLHTACRARRSVAWPGMAAAAHTCGMSSSVRALPVSQNLCLLCFLRGWWLGLVPFCALGCCMRRAALYNASIAGTALPRSIAGPVCRREEFMYCAASASGACYCLGPLWAMHAGPQDVLPMQWHACAAARCALYISSACAPVLLAAEHWRPREHCE